MLEDKELKEIKKLLETSQNPLFFYDNDSDGLCSYLLLARALDRGKGVVIRSYPGLNEGYLRKVEELNPDLIVILDKPVVDKEFIEKVDKKGIPILWIDHHETQVDKEILDSVYYFNSYPEAEPVTFICYNVFKNKKEQWLALIGSVGDTYVPDFAKSFSKEFPDLFDYNVKGIEALYKTKIGEIVKILNFGLKDSITNVVNLTKYLLKANSAYDILEENSFTKTLHKKFDELNKVYKLNLENAESVLAEDPDSKILFYVYSGKSSMSAEIANELYFRHPKKIVAVAYKNSDKVNVSLRGKNVRDAVIKITGSIENSTGGGHKNACGASLPLDKLEEFKKLLYGFF